MNGMHEPYKYWKNFLIQKKKVKDKNGKLSCTVALFIKLTGIGPV